MRWVAFIVGVIVMLLGTEAKAQDLGEALRLEERGLLDEALEELEELVRQPDQSRDDLIVILQHLAVLRYAAGDEAGAAQALARLEVIEPDAELPDSAPPSLVRMQEGVRDRLGGRRLRARLEMGHPEAGEVPIRVRVVNDVFDLVRRVELLGGGDILDVASGEGPAYRVFAPRRVISEGLTVRLLDSVGTVLWEGTVDEQISDESERRSGHGGGSASRWRWLQWSLIGAGGLSVVVGGILIGVDGTSTGEQRVVDGMLEERFRRTAGGGWTLVSLGLVSAAAGVIWLVLTRSSDASDGREDEEFAPEWVGRW